MCWALHIRRGIIQIIIVFIRLLRWRRRWRLGTPLWDTRRFGEAMLRSGIVERVIFIIIIITTTSRLSVWWGRRGSPRCVDGRTSITGGLAWRWRRDASGSCWRKRRGLPSLLGAAWRMNRDVISNSTLIKAGVTLVRPQGILVFDSRGNISVIVPVVFGHLSFCLFSSLSRARHRTNATISG
jgi:hypothetical protein